MPIRRDDPTLIDFLLQHSTLHTGIVEKEHDEHGHYETEYATFCGKCENVYEDGDEGFDALLCPDCGSCEMHEIRWVRE